MESSTGGGNGDKQPLSVQQQQHDKASVSKLNIIRAQVFFLLSTLSEDKWDSTVQQLREVWNLKKKKTIKKISAKCIN
jgi:hypothetical protein